MNEYLVRRAIAVITLAIGLAALGYAGHSFYESKQLRARLQQATATVGGPAGRTSGNRGVNLLAIHYTDASGREATGSIGANEGYKTGDRVPVLYDPASPGFAMLPKYANFGDRFALIPALVGLFFVIGAVVSFLMAKPKAPSDGSGG